MRTFCKLGCVEIIRPEFLTVGFYRFSTVKNKPYFFNTVIINTGTDNVKVTRNAHVFNRVCNSGNCIVRIRINKNVVRTANRLVATFIFSHYKYVVFTGFLLVDIKLFLPAVHLSNITFINIALTMSEYRECCGEHE